MTPPTTPQPPRQNIDHPDEGESLRSVDLLGESSTTVTGLVVRNPKGPNTWGLFAAATAVGGCLWLLLPTADTTMEANPTAEEVDQHPTTVSVAVSTAEPYQRAGDARSSDSSAFATGAGFQLLVDRSVQVALDRFASSDTYSSDQSFPLGAPHD